MGKEYFVEVAMGSTAKPDNLYGVDTEPLLTSNTNYSCRVNLNYYVYNRLMTILNLFLVTISLISISAEVQGSSGIAGFIAAIVYAVLSMLHIHLIHRVSQREFDEYRSVVRLYSVMLPLITVGAVIGILWWQNVLNDEEHIKSWDGVEKFSVVTFSLPAICTVALGVWKLFSNMCC